MIENYTVCKAISCESKEECTRSKLYSQEWEKKYKWCIEGNREGREHQECERMDTRDR